MLWRAALVHLFTASGMIPVLLSVEAVWRGDATAALLWLLAAGIIDGLDGPLAQRFAVTEHLPQIDGAILDHVIDYASYVFVPALIMVHFNLLPAAWALPAACFVLVASLYTFANRDLKTAENDFRGFPALWNVVVFYMVVFKTPQTANLIAVAVLGLMVFAPIRVVHPVRVVAMRRVTLPAAIAWLAGMLAYLTAGRDAVPFAGDIVFFAVTAYFIGLSAWRSVALYGKD